MFTHMKRSADADFTDGVEDYDAWYRTPWGAYAEQRERALLAEMGRVQSGDRALDVGCGTGRMVAWLLEGEVDARGVEPAPDMIGAAHTRLEANGCAPARAIPALAERLPFADAAFDLVTTITVLEFTPDREAVLREMARVCRGRVFVGALNSDSAYGRSIARGEMGQTLSRARLHTLGELVELVDEHVRPTRMQWRTTLLGTPTEDSRELALQRHLDDRAGRRRVAHGGFIAIVAEV